MEEIGIHPEELTKHLVEVDVRPALFDVQERLAKEELTHIDGRNRFSVKGEREPGHRMNEPSDSIGVPGQNPLAMALGRMFGQRRLVIVADIPGPTSIGVEIGEPLIDVDWLELPSSPENPFGSIWQLQNDLSFRRVCTREAAACITHRMCIE